VLEIHYFTKRYKFMNTKQLLLIVCPALLTGVVVVHKAEAGPMPPPSPPPQTGNPVYTQNPLLSDFTAGVQEYAKFIDGIFSGTLPYTPTTDILTAENYPRVIGRDANPPIVVEFPSAVSQILIFNNIDHVGFAWDAYQYNIYGGTAAANNVINFTLLFDPLSVNELNNTNNIATPFTLKTWSGTGPTLVNNTLTPGKGSLSGSIGYEEYFDFGPSNAFKYYAFRTSTLAVNTAGEIEQELSAVAKAVAPVPVPEPSNTTWLIVSALAGVVLRKLSPGAK
jgi:hypothetical protein